jgi:hypothetical protein
VLKYQKMKLSNLKSKPVQHQIAEYLAGKVRMQEFADTLLEDKCHLIFKNYRVEQGVPVGLRLSATGHRLLARFITITEFKLITPIVGVILVDLDRAMKRPYYLSKQKIAFYDKEDAAWFKLGGHDLKYFAGNL